MKVCRDCTVEKPISEFHRTDGGRFGVKSYCKPCDGNRSREWKRKNPERHAEYNREWQRKWRAANPEKARAADRASRAKRPKRVWSPKTAPIYGPPTMAQARRSAWRRASPEARRAGKAIYRAVKEGRLVRPTVCEECHKEHPMPIEGHHSDYSARLDVEWLCNPCHRIRHRTVLAEVPA